MPGDEEIEETPNPEIPPGTQGGSPSEGEPESTPPEATTSPETKSSKVITIPTSAMSKIKAAERERGRKSALAEMDAQARKLGYRSWEDMVKARERQSQRQQETKPQAQTKPDEAPPENPKALTRLQKENQRLLEERRRLNRARAHAERRSKTLEQQLAAKEAETELRIAATRAGIKDVDYAVHLLRKEIEGKSAKDLTNFDENVYFEKVLRDRAPYLYGVETRPANTGPAATQRGGKEPVPAPKNEPVEENGQKLDARKLSPEEYNALLRKRGILPPGLGIPS